jgi:hypothetical protein
MAAGVTITGATSTSPPGQLRRKNPRKPREKPRISTKRKRPSTTVHPRRAGLTAGVAGHPRRLSRNGRTTRTASRVNRAPPFQGYFPLILNGIMLPSSLLVSGCSGTISGDNNFFLPFSQPRISDISAVFTIRTPIFCMSRTLARCTSSEDAPVASSISATG